MLNQVAHIFPAFVLKYTGKELSILEENKVDFNACLSLCEQQLGLHLNNFDLRSNSFINQEYKNQVLSYLFSISFSDILKRKQTPPACVSGFSMGIYSAFYHANVISFESGLQLISDVYQAIKTIMAGRRFKMASVIGFEHDELMAFVSQYASLEPVIKNGSYSYVVAGEEFELKKLLMQLEKEGAIHLSLFPVSFPYHSKLLNQAIDVFETIVAKFTFAHAKVPYVSMIDQSKLLLASELKTEIVKNIIQPLDFYETIQYLISSGYNKFIEVGADASLLKSSKFIEGDFEFKAVAKGRVL